MKALDGNYSMGWYLLYDDSAPGDSGEPVMEKKELRKKHPQRIAYAESKAKLLRT